MTVDAILCHYNHEERHIRECVKSLNGQVRQILLVLDGLAEGGREIYGREFNHVTKLRRQHRHNPANSFNYGVFHSNADYILYVDPHTVFRPRAVKRMLAALGNEYDFCLGTGNHILIDPADPWAKALSNIKYTEVPLTFLMSKTLWDRMRSIPEPPYCHMDILADKLLGMGELIAQVKNVCTHDTGYSIREALNSFWQAGLSYGALHRAGYSTTLASHTSNLETDHITLLVKLLLASLHQLGMLSGLGKIPQEPLDLGNIQFKWVGK